MKIIEQNIFYSMLINGQWNIHAPIWKNEGSALCYVDKRAEESSWKKNPMCLIPGHDFKSKKYQAVEIDITKLKIIYCQESKDLRKKRKKKMSNQGVNNMNKSTPGPWESPNI